MRLVVDANIVFSLLIKDGLTAELFFDERLTFISPPQLLKEIEEHRQTIRRKTGRQDVDAFLQVVLGRITIIDVEVQEPFLPDPDDSPYIELARRYQSPLWTSDKVLLQAPVQTMRTDELRRLLDKH